MKTIREERAKEEIDGLRWSIGFLERRVERLMSRLFELEMAWNSKFIKREFWEERKEEEK